MSDQGAIKSTNPVAAIDIGTNSVHLVIADFDPSGHIHIIDSEKVVLKLGREINEKGHLSSAAINKTAETIQRMKEICYSYTKNIKAVATHATREAKNYKELLQTVQARTGIRIEPIDGFEEARLSFLGMRQGLPLEAETCLALDIGGGSTEIIIAKGDEILHVSSLKLGAVVLTESFLKSSKPSKNDIEEMEKHIYQRLAPLVSVIKEIKYTKAVVTSGTAKAVAIIHERLVNHKELVDANGYTFTRKALIKIYEELGDIGEPKNIKTKFNVDQNRADIILAGCGILRCISRYFKVREWTVSTYGLREGTVMDICQRARPGRDKTHLLTDLRLRNILSFGAKLRIEETYANHVSDLALQIYDGLEKHLFKDSSPEIKRSNYELLQAAAYLHEVGKFVSHSRFHKHSQYIIANCSLMGFTQTEKELMGLIARFHRKSPASQERAEKGSLIADNIFRINALASCLRLACALNRTRRGRIKKLTVSNTAKKAHINVHYTGVKPPEAELYRANKDLKSIAKILDMDLTLEASRISV